MLEPKSTLRTTPMSADEHADFLLLRSAVDSSVWKSSAALQRNLQFWAEKG